MTLKPFDLTAAKAGAPVCTGDRQPVRLICFDAKDDMYTIIGLVTRSNGKEEVETYQKDGSVYRAGESSGDLYMIPVINQRDIELEFAVASNGMIRVGIPGKIEHYASDVASFVRTIPIEWEQGEHSSYANKLSQYYQYSEHLLVK